MNVEIAIPSLFNTPTKQGENGTETQLGSSKFHYSLSKLSSRDRKYSRKGIHLIGERADTLSRSSMENAIRIYIYIYIDT